ncbi:hypothetical protein KXV85_002905, partial [Aspergillus fumigatus]
RRLHGRRYAEHPESHPDLAVGQLVHHEQEVERGEQLRRADAGFGDHAELRLAARERHRPLHDRKPSARRQDGVQGESGLVAQARTQSEGNRVHADLLRRDARRRPAVGRSRRDRAGSDPGYRARQLERQCRSADRPGAAHHLPRLRHGAERAVVLQHQGQEPVQGYPRPRSLLQGRRRRPDQVAGDARAVDAIGAD